jgi:WD40 repeat protein/uncharacterized caspase-like protein
MNQMSVIAMTFLFGLSLSTLSCASRSIGNRPGSPGSNASAGSGKPRGGSAVGSEEALPFELVPQLGHGLSVDGISTSQDGKVAATASADKTVRVWDIDAGILLRRLPIRQQVMDVAILRDGVRAVVVASLDVQLWDLVHGKRLAQFRTDNAPAIRVALLHHGDKVVLADAAGGVELWDMSPPKCVRNLFAERKGRYLVWDLDVSPDDRVVATANENGVVDLIDGETGRHLHELTGHVGDIKTARFSNSGRTIVSFGADKTIRTWDVQSGTQQRSFSPGMAIGAAALITDTTAVFSGYEGALQVLDLTTGRILRDLKRWPGVPWQGISAVAVTRDGRHAVSSDRGGAVLFSNLSDGTPIHATRAQRLGPFSLALSPRGDRVAVGFGGGEVDIWDAVLGERVRRIPPEESVAGGAHTTRVAISTNGHLLLRAMAETLSFWDLRSGARLREADKTRFTINSLVVSPDGKLVAAGGIPGVGVFEIDTGRQLWSAVQQVEVIGLGFTPDSTQLFAGADNENDRLYDARTGVVLRQFKGPKIQTLSAEFLDQQTVLLGASSSLGLWDMRSGEPSRTYAATSQNAGFGAFSIDHKWVISGDDTGVMSLWDTRSGKLVHQFSGHVDDVEAIVPSRDGKLVFSTSFDGTVRVTSMETLTSNDPNKDPRSMVWVADRDDWLAHSADGYFDASRRGGNLVAAVNGLEGFRVDQLAVRNNRPDLALGRIGLGTKEALALFASRHQQRLRRLGYDEADLSSHFMSAPRALIADFAPTGRRAHLRCSFSGNGRKLKRYFTFVNDVAVGNGEGTPISGTHATVELDVELSSGRNKVEISVLNDVGVESFRDVRTTIVDEPVRGNLYYLGFGVSSYADPRLALKFAHKDALDLGQALERMSGHGFDRVIGRTLTDSQVTKSSIAAARAFLSQAKLDDTVVVFVAGHGVFGNGPHEQYYFVTYDTDISRIHQTAAGFGLIEDLLTGIAPRNKLLLLDTCESGERDGEEEVVRVSAGRSRGLTARGIRPVVLDTTAKPATRPRFNGYQDRFIFNDLSRRTGTIVFSAARGNELSYEDDRLQNGMFTYEIVRALSGPSADADRNGSVTTDELRAYVSRAVATRTEGLQNPTVDRDNLEALFGFPVAGRSSQ